MQAECPTITWTGSQGRRSRESTSSTTPAIAERPRNGIATAFVDYGEYRVYQFFNCFSKLKTLVVMVAAKI